MNLKKLLTKEETPAMKGYVFTKHQKTNQQGITCLTCKKTSYNPYDIKHLYCGCCHRFHADA